MAHEEVNPAQVGFSEPVRAIEWIPGHNRSPFANDSGPVAGTQRQASYSTRQFESDLNLAVELSMQDQAGINLGTMEVANPHERKRSDDDSPVGLKNVGNSCYFTSIAQNYFTIDKFREAILSLEFPEDLERNDIRCVAQELQYLFAKLVLTRRKYIDPTDFLNTLVDKEGNCIHRGAQEDPTEFRMFFLEMIQESISKILEEQEKEDDTCEMEMKQSGKRTVTDDDGLIFDMDNLDIGNDDEKLEIVENNENEENEEKKIEKKKEESQPKIIDTLLSGKLMQIIEGMEEDGTPVESKQETSFTEVILDLNNGRDIYESLDQYTELVQLDEFTTPKGFKSKATKIISFKELPPILSFQLQRVDYDADSNKLVKNHSRFEFPKKLYLDRYMTENIKTTLERREILAKLMSKKPHFRALLENLLNYEGSTLSVQKLLSTSLEFLQKKGDCSENDVNIRTLEDCLEVAKQREKEYRDQIAIIDSKISELYSDMNKEEYRLHSMLVHAGKEAGGGHYWAFIYDIDSNSWYKYNDTNVIKVDEDIVFKESLGGFGNESAYCLTYVKPSLHSGNPSIADNSRFISPQLQVEIAMDNEQLEEELERWDRGERDPIINNDMDMQSISPEDSVRTEIHFDSSNDWENDPLANTGLGSNRMSRDDIANFNNDFTEKLERVECWVELYFGIDLRSFSHFLASVNEVSILNYEVACSVLIELFKISPKSPQAQQVPLFSAFSRELDTIRYEELRIAYNACLNSWQYFIQGLKTITEYKDLMQATKYFYFAYDACNDIYFPIANKQNEFEKYLLKSLEILCQLGIKDNRWQRNVDVRRYTLLAVDISSKLPNKNIYTNLCERWMPIIDELEFSSLSLEPKTFLYSLKEKFSNSCMDIEIEPCATEVNVSLIWNLLSDLIPEATSLLDETLLDIENN